MTPSLHVSWLQCFSVLVLYAVSALLIRSLFYFWVIRCSVGATYTVVFSFTVLCQLLTFSVICYFHHAHCFIYIFFMMLSLSPKGHDM